MERDYGADVRDFLDFLDERKPAHFVAEALSSLLRTEPPIVFSAADVADIVADWVGERAARTCERPSDLMLAATRSIVDAYNIDAVAGMRPKAFYRPYRERLIERCPEAERSVLTAALDALQAGGPPRFQRLSASDLARAAGLAPRHEASAASEQDFDAALDRIRARPHLPEEEFDEAMPAIERFLGDPDLVPTQPAVVRALEIATDVFNDAAVAHAGRLFAAVDEALSHPSVAEVRRRDARGASRRKALDDDILVRWVNDDRRRAEAAPIVRFFDDYAPSHLLGLLAAETLPARATLLLNLLDTHGAGAVPSVLDAVESGGAAAHLEGLIRLVARWGASSDVERRRAVERLGPSLTAAEPGVREAAVEALARLGGREVAPHAIRALDAEAYRVELRGEDASRHLEAVMGLLVDGGLESAVAVVAETVAEERDGGFRLGKSLRDAALGALERRRGPLPRRAALSVADALRKMGRRRLGIFGGAGDAETAARLIALVADSDDPEVVEVRDAPALRKLVEQSQR